MRLALLAAILVFVASAHGQQQERRLVDRLLEPNTRLENSQQHKQFNGAGAVTAASVSTRSLYVPEKKLSNSFAGTRQFATSSFRARQFGTREAYLPSPRPVRSYPTNQAREISAAHGVTRNSETRQFAGNRPFLEQGKSQKALHAQDRPLSIDDIRELLNKNK